MLRLRHTLVPLALTLLAAAPAAAQTVFTDNFNAGIGQWGTATSQSWVVSASVGGCFIDGTECADLTTQPGAGGGTASLWRSVFGLQVGQQYTLAAQYRRFGDAGIGVYFLAGSGSYTPPTLCALGQTCTLTFTFTAEAPDLIVALGANRLAPSPTSPFGGVSWDNASLTAQVVPEPGTWALFGTGLAGLAAVARRRRRGA